MGRAHLFVELCRARETGSRRRASRRPHGHLRARDQRFDFRDLTVFNFQPEGDGGELCLLPVGPSSRIVARQATCPASGSVTNNRYFPLPVIIFQ